MASEQAIRDATIAPAALAKRIVAASEPVSSHLGTT